MIPVNRSFSDTFRPNRKEKHYLKKKSQRGLATSPKPHFLQGLFLADVQGWAQTQETQGSLGMKSWAG